MGVPDVFISYSRKDQEKADLLAELLSKEGWEVWKDNRIGAGQFFEEKINENLNLAKAVIVLWSRNSVKSTWVLKEAQIALDQKKLKPVMIESCRIPKGFKGVNFAVLKKWKGEVDFRQLNVLYEGLSDTVLPSRLENIRVGYNPVFLGKSFRINLPEVRGTADLIHYANFSIVMNPSRRMPWYVAYHVDGKQLKRGLPRENRWTPDPAWPLSLQPSDSHFRQSGWNRGHLLSPMTACWGDDRIAAIAKRQANYWTNTTPQSTKMNTVWFYAAENLERSIAAKEKRIIGFSGPVYREEDKSFRDEFEKDGMFKATETYRIPSAFWKMVCIKKEKKIEHIAFIFDEGKLAQEQTFNLLDHLVTMEQLEETTRLRFWNQGINYMAMTKEQVQSYIA